MSGLHALGSSSHSRTRCAAAHLVVALSLSSSAVAYGLVDYTSSFRISALSSDTSTDGNADLAALPMDHATALTYIVSFGAVIATILIVVFFIFFIQLRKRRREHEMEFHLDTAAQDGANIHKAMQDDPKSIPTTAPVGPLRSTRPMPPSNREAASRARSIRTPGTSQSVAESRVFDSQDENSDRDASIRIPPSPPLTPHEHEWNVLRRTRATAPQTPHGSLSPNWSFPAPPSLLASRIAPLDVDLSPAFHVALADVTSDAPFGVQSFAEMDLAASDIWLTDADWFYADSGCVQPLHLGPDSETATAAQDVKVPVVEKGAKAAPDSMHWGVYLT